MSSESPLDLPAELQHLIEKREAERRQEDRREGTSESVEDQDDEIVESDEYVGPDRRSDGERRVEDRRESD